MKDPLTVYRECHNPRDPRVEAAIQHHMAMTDALLNHCDKDGGECRVCSEIVCPHKDPLHFHHDGCPSCCSAEERKQAGLGLPCSDTCGCERGTCKLW